MHWLPDWERALMPRSGRLPWRSRRPVTAKKEARGNLDQDVPDAVSVLGPHLGQSPSPAGSRVTGTPAAAGRACSADIPHPDPNHHRAPGRPGRVPWAPRADPGRGRKPSRDGLLGRLPADGQARHITVEPQAVARVAGGAGSGRRERPRCHSAIFPAGKDPGNRAAGGCRDGRGA